MKHFCFLLLLLFFNTSLYAEENPFERMRGKSYAEYSEDLKQVYIDIDIKDSVYSKNLLRQLKDVVDKTNNKTFLLEYKRMMISYRFREDFRNNSQNTYTVDSAIVDLRNILTEAEREGELILILRLQYSLMNLSIFEVRNYEQAFLIAQQLDKDLQQITPDVFPDMLYYYLEIASLHYQFSEYDKAEYYYMKILEYPNIAFNHNILPGAYNGLGLVYMTYYKLYDEAERWFQLILDMKPDNEGRKVILDEWSGIAFGNIGESKVLRGNYDQAIPNLLYSLDKMLSYNDYNFASSSAVILAEAYAKKENYPLMKLYLDKAEEYNRVSWKNRDHLLFPLYGKYYIAIGDKKKAMLYLDSTIIAQEKHANEFNTMHLLRAEQRTALIEQAAKDNELKTEKVKSRSYKLISIAVSFTLLLVLILFIYVTIIYKKKQTIYKELVKNAREWAMQPSALEPKPSYAEKKGDYEEIIQGINHLMETEKVYLDGEISLDSFAFKLSVNKTLLSQAFNRGIGKNFNQYMNEYRIKESIRIMTEKASYNYSIDQIASFSGFNDRKTFYRIFKSFTGISPSEYRDNHTSSS